MSTASLDTQASGKRVALMQPTFLPWLGFFGLIKNADEFVFLDDFQFVRRSFHQRNRIFVNQNEVGFISVPVEHAGQQDTPINQIKPLIDKSWKRKFLGAVKQNYSFSTYLPQYYDFIEEWLNTEFENLAAFNMAFVGYVVSQLGLDTNLSLSSKVEVNGQRSARILSLLKAFEAKTYLSAFGSYDYMEEDSVLDASDFCFLFQNFEPVPYSQQQSPEFVPYLSILDCLLQHGPEETLKIIECSDNRFFTVQEMRDMNSKDTKINNA